MKPDKSGKSNPELGWQTTIWETTCTKISNGEQNNDSKKMCSMCTVHVQKEKYARFWVKGIHLPVCQNREALSSNIKHGRSLCQETNWIWYCWVYYCSTSSPSCWYELYPFLPMERLWHLTSNREAQGHKPKSCLGTHRNDGRICFEHTLGLHETTFTCLTAKAKGLNLC